MLNHPTSEQLEVIEKLKTHNVLVDAVAGSGKTTTILHIAKTFPDLRICCVTYNTKLKSESTIKPLHIQCQECEHKFDQPFSLNASDFFV